MSNQLTLTPQVRSWLNAHVDSKTKIRMAEDEQVQDDLAVFFSEDENPEVRVALAANPSLPIDLQRKLAEDENIDVLVSLSSNINLDRDIAVKLTERSESKILSQLSLNSNLPVHAQQKIVTLTQSLNVYLALAKSKYLDEQVAWFLFDLKNITITKALSRNPFCSPKVLETIYQHNSSTVVLSYLIRNPQTPQHILLKNIHHLNRDGN